MRARVFGTLLVAAGLSAGSAWAVPSFARQTGMSCTQCHTVFPELTPFGREFKVTGYTLSTTKQLTEGGGDKRLLLELPLAVPLGGMAIVGYTHTAKDQQVAASGPPARNDNFSLPQEFSLFYAGKVAPMLGAFVQLTYEGQSDHFGFDNTEIRFAHSVQVAGKNLTFGATINNNPTVSDLWNSTPAWGAPFVTSAGAPEPSAATLIEGGLAQGVAGGGLYGYYSTVVNVYAEVDAYHSAPLGVSLPLDASTGATGVIDGFMPYWRLSVDKAFGSSSLMLGTFGLHGTLLPGGATPLQAPGDRYTDVAADAQYQYIGDAHIVTGTLAYIHEALSLDASGPGHSAELHSVKGSVSYVFQRAVGARATFQTMRGSDPAARATALTGEVFATPWLNTRLGVEYTSYFDFDGDAANPHAKDTLYGYLWFAF